MNQDGNPTYFPITAARAAIIGALASIFSWTDTVQENGGPETLFAFSDYGLHVSVRFIPKPNANDGTNGVVSALFGKSNYAAAGGVLGWLELENYKDPGEAAAYVRSTCERLHTLVTPTPQPSAALVLQS